MSEDNDDLEIKDLYDRFVEELSSGNIEESYYDIDDLLDIFDYANESYDSYVCNAVLRLGARLYPDNDDLRVRQGIALIQHIDTDRELFERFIKDNAECDSLMWRIIRLYLLDEADSDTRVAALEEVLEGAHFDEDEQVVQFVNAIEYLRCYDWLLDNVARIRERCSYAPTLLYDVAVIAHRRVRLDIAATLLEELTELEPFSIDFWILLAKVYDDSGDNEGGQTALDYARTLDPDNMQARVYAYERAELFNLEDIDALIARLEELVSLDDTNFIFKDMLAKKYVYAGRTADAARIYRTMFEAVPYEVNALVELLRIDTSHIRRDITRHMEAVRKASTDTDYDVTIQFADNVERIAGAVDAYCYTDPEVAEKLYDAISELGYRDVAARHYFMHMYLARNYDRAVAFLGSDLFKDNKIEFAFDVIPVITAILYLDRKYDLVSKIVTYYLETTVDHEITDVVSSFTLLGARMRMAQLKDMAGNPDADFGHLNDDPLEIREAFYYVTRGNMK